MKPGNKRTQACFVGGGLASLTLLTTIATVVAPTQAQPQKALLTPAITLKPMAQAKPKAAVLSLDAQGLQVVNATTGSTRSLPFGMKEAEVVTIVNNLQGKNRDRGTNSECGAGPLGYASWGNGLTLWFNQGQFKGWAVDGRSPNSKKLTTIAGIGTGSTRSQLNKAYQVKVQSTSLGTEFTAGGLGGILTGTKPTDTITNLWSGTTCLFR